MIQKDTKPIRIIFTGLFTGRILYRGNRPVILENSLARPDPTRPDPTRPDPTPPTNFENLLTQAAGRVMASEKSLDIPRFNLAFFVFRLLCSAVVVKAKHTLIRQKESRALRYRGGTFWLPTFSDLRRVPSEHLRS